MFKEIRYNKRYGGLNMDIEAIKEAKELENRIKYCRRARNLAKDATFGYFNNKFSLGFNIGCLCEDKTFYESLVKLLNDTEKRFQYKFDIL